MRGRRSFPAAEPEMRFVRRVRIRAPRVVAETFSQGSLNGMIADEEGRRLARRRGRRRRRR